MMCLNFVGGPTCWTMVFNLAVIGKFCHLPNNYEHYFDGAI